MIKVTESYPGQLFPLVLATYFSGPVTVLIQDFFSWLRAGSTPSLFATFISLIHTVVAAGVIAIWYVTAQFLDRKQS
ncbi:hypothetical protein SAMN05216350_10887 [Polaromonas sp. YR568]|nr:hypothetical protein SAMN05216350_10887 [Polaromonas sp. YR568]